MLHFSGSHCTINDGSIYFSHNVNVELWVSLALPKQFCCRGFRLTAQLFPEKSVCVITNT